MVLNWRVLLSGLALPLVAGVGLTQLPEPPDPGQPGPGPVTLTEATADWVLTEPAAGTLAEQGVGFAPAAGSTEVPDAPRPSTQLALSVGSVGLDLLSGVVHFDGGFTLTGESTPEQGGSLEFSSIASNLADGVASAWVAANDEPGERIDALTYDLTSSTIEVDGTTITLTEVELFLTDEAVAAILEVVPDVLVTTTEPFIDVAAVGTFEPPAAP